MNNLAILISVNISLLSIGTEILLGDTINTNLSSLGQILYNNGFVLTSEVTVPDEKNLIKEKLHELLKNNDVIITCGGIGPTEDDFTKDVISEYLGLNLVLDSEHLSWMESRWESRGLVMPQNNIKQAELPEGSKKLKNTNGTSPGIHIQNNDKDIFILPGPPREFIPLVEDEIVPFLKNNFESTNKDYEFIMFYNQAESALAQQIDTFKPENLDIAYLASKGIIKLRYDKNSVNSKDLIEFKKNIKNTLSDDILSTENIPASKVLLNILNENELTLSLVESITGGSLSSALVSHPGASKTLLASNTLYTTFSKEEFLQSEINDDWIILTESLATKSRLKYSSDISLAILGEAGPVTSSKYKLGQIFISITSNSKTETFEHNLRGSRDDIINRSVNNAIWDLIKFIKKL
jgi:nicotinamide-nucleotide amidase